MLKWLNTLWGWVKSISEMSTFLHELYKASSGGNYGSWNRWKESIYLYE